jgi:hypothetical protein
MLWQGPRKPLLVGLAALICALIAPASAAAIPTQTQPPSIVNPPNPPYEGQTLQGDDGEYSPVISPTIDRQWRRCDATNTNDCTDIPGADQSTYQLAPADIGSTIRYQVTASCAIGCTPITSSSDPTGVVRQAAPTVSASAPSRSGRTLTAHATSDGRPPRTLSYRWERCDSSGGSCSDVAGPSGASSTFKLGTPDIDHRLRVRVGVSNNAGSDTDTSSATEVIDAAPPVSTSPPALSGTAREGSTLTSTLGSWSGEGPIAYRVGWVRCATTDLSSCASIPGATSASYRVTSADVDRKLRSVVTAEGLGSAVRYSNPVTATLFFTSSTPTETPAPAPSVLSPFPRVAISGRARRSATVVTRLLVRAPRGSRVTVRCRGRCRVRRSSARAGRRAIRFRRMQRAYRPGVRLEVFVTKTGKVGSYTRFRFRRRRAPSRVDGCLQPGASRPSRCPG